MYHRSIKELKPPTGPLCQVLAQNETVKTVTANLCVGGFIFINSNDWTNHDQFMVLKMLISGLR